MHQIPFGLIRDTILWSFLLACHQHLNLPLCQPVFGILAVVAMKSFSICVLIPFFIQYVYATPAAINERDVAATNITCLVDQLTPVDTTEILIAPLY